MSFREPGAKRAPGRGARADMRVLVLGAGGHGQVVADILLRMAEAGAPMIVSGFLDDHPELAGRRLLGVPVLGPLAARASLPHDAVVIAVGSNRRREALAADLAREGERFVTACHPRAVIAPGVVLGEGTMVCAGAVVNTGSAVGAHVILNTNCSVDHHNTIAEYAHIAPGVTLGGEVRVGAGALVGIGATVVPRRSVGAWAVIGAGAVVTRDIPDGVTAVGVPAAVRASRTSKEQR